MDDEAASSSHERRQLKREQRREHHKHVTRRQQRRQRAIQAFVGVLVVAGLIGGYLMFAQGDGSSSPQVAPTWKATSIDGEAYSSDSLRGDVYVVDFFFTWCQICKAQLPHKKALVEHFNDNPDFHFLSVSADPSDSASALDQYRSSNGAAWPFAQDRDALYQKFRVDSRPFMVFVDRDGYVVKTIRSLTESGKLIRIVEPLLAKQPIPSANVTEEPSSSNATAAYEEPPRSYESLAVDSRRR